MQRRRFTPLVIAGMVTFLVGSLPASDHAGFQTATTVTPTPIGESVDVGYSIFEGTMAGLTWVQVEQAAKQGAIVLLPVAVIEEHGPHMGLGIDTYVSYLASHITRRELEARGTRTLIAPPVYWGINAETGRFPGSFSLRPQTFKALLHDALDSLRRWGFSDVYVINTHGDVAHNQILVEGIEEARHALDISAHVLLTRGEAFRYNVRGREAMLIQGDPKYEGPWPTRPEIHAGAFEVGLMAHYLPRLVDLELAKTLQPTSSFEPWGYWGDPAGFDPGASQAYFEAYYQASAEAIAEQIRQAEAGKGGR